MGVLTGAYAKPETRPGFKPESTKGPKMRDSYNSFDFELHGVAFRAFLVADEDHGRPWEESDGHGPVRQVAKGYNGLEKRPGERPLYVGGRGEYSWAYDWQAAMKIARRDGWGVSGGRLPGETARQYAARAVTADFEFLRAWCNDAWHYCGVCVSRLDEDGETLDEPYSYALWGIESNAADYLREVANENAAEILHANGLTPEQKRAAWRAALKEAREARYWAARDVQTVGA